MPNIPKRPRPVRTDERDIQQEIREGLGLEPGLVLWRNAQAFAEVWDEHTGKVRHHHGGLGTGSADLVGILRQRDGIGRFFALEIKKATGRASAEQNTWLLLVRSYGGFAAIVRSVDEARAALARARAGASE